MQTTADMMNKAPSGSRFQSFCIGVNDEKYVFCELLGTLNRKKIKIKTTAPIGTLLMCISNACLLLYLHSWGDLHPETPTPCYIFRKRPSNWRANTNADSKSASDNTDAKWTLLKPNCPSNYSKRALK